MKISSSFNINKTDKSCYQSFKGVPTNPKYIPEFVGNLGKVAGEYINTPEQKLFLALSALAFQPIIDLHFANDEQKVDSAIKSAAKSIAGGITGVTIRAAFLKFTNHFIGLQKHNNINRLFMPSDAILMKLDDPNMAQLRVKQYTQTLGSLFAVLTMILFTNSNVDVPLTSDIQDLISGVVKENKSWVKSFSDVKNSRSKKISDWFGRRKDFLSKVANKTKRIINIIFEKPATAQTKETKTQ